MKKALLLFTLAFAGCLNTETKTNLKRPDFSQPAPVTTGCCGCCAPVQTRTASAAPETFDRVTDDDIKQMLREIDDWFKENPDYDTRSRSF